MDDEASVVCSNYMNWFHFSEPCAPQKYFIYIDLDILLVRMYVYSFGRE